MQKRWLQVGIAWCVALSIHVSALGQCRVVQVAAGTAFSMALGQDGRLWGWGYNGYGQLGIGTFDDRSLPIQVATLSDVMSVGAGARHVMAWPPAVICGSGAAMEAVSLVTGEARTSAYRSTCLPAPSRSEEGTGTRWPCSPTTGSWRGDITEPGRSVMAARMTPTHRLRWSVLQGCG